MLQSTLKNYIKKECLKSGIEINGKQPWDIQVHDDRLYARLLKDGSLGFGEAYMDGWFDVECLDELICHIYQKKLERKEFPGVVLLARVLASLFLNEQSRKKALEVGTHHYDLSNHLFQCMLDKRMTYSCGYWKQAKNLNEAQEAKLDLVCRKIALKPGMKVLDIGFGWGSFAKFAAEKYGAHVVGITISEQQLELAKELCKGLPIELHFQDYRDIKGEFDRIVSIGQMEHVGYKNYSQYMKIVAAALKDDGLFLLHTIGHSTSTRIGDPWLLKYIFPNAMAPSVVQLSKASEGIFTMEDWHNFGSDYDKTLMAWFDNFEKHWGTLKSQYDERFYRMWKYYLLSCAGCFRARKLQLWQIVYSKRGIPGGYTSIR